MTREEAIETLKANYPDACYEQLREAVDAAIEALKAQDTAGDTIYRQVAIDAVQDIGRLATLQDNDAVVRMSAVEYVLFNLPSAQPEIIACGDCKHWIWHDRRCGYWNHGVKPLEWCCHAERRTDESN